MLCKLLFIAVEVGASALPLAAQNETSQQMLDPSTREQWRQTTPNAPGKASTFCVTVVERTTAAINYR